MQRLLILVLAMLAVSGCRKEAPQAQPQADAASTQAAAAPAPGPVTLEDVVETDPRYIVGITYPPAVNRYPQLALELKAFTDAARAELMEAVQEIDADAGPVMYDLALEYKVVADTPRVFAVAADGSSFTGGAHGSPLIARFVWLPQEEKRLTAAELIPDPAAWPGISGYVREQLHAALSQRVDADDLDPVERERVVRSAGKMIDAGTAPEAEHFSEFEPVMGADGRMEALRFVFPPYQVGPYSDGVQAVEVPASVLLPHVAPAFRSLFTGGVSPVATGTKA